MRSGRLSLRRARRIRFEPLENRYMLAITGDYDGDATVDTDDYNSWRATFGNTVPPGTGADGSDNGVIDAADYVAWRNNVGATGQGNRISISIDQLSEAVEESPGAIIWRNSDFSKQSLAAMQPEMGEPLYVPDYSAPSTVFDPASALDFTDATVSIDADMVAGHTIRFTYDTAKLRLWTTTQWTGMTAVGGGRFQIPTGVTLTPAASSLSFLIEGLANSTAFSTDSIMVEAILTGGGTTLTDRGDYTVVETGVGVDGDRDTAIDFTNSHDRQLLFWFNNDHEGFDEEEPEIEVEIPDTLLADNGDNLIDQRRDLEDLAPLRLNVAPLLVANAFDTADMGTPAPGQLRVTYRLRLENSELSSLRLFYSNNQQTDAIRHVNDPNTANIQATDPFFRMAAGPSFTTQQQLQQISAGLNSFLFEAIGGAYGSELMYSPNLQFETIIQYADGTTTSKVQNVALDLRDIKRFYTRWDIDYGLNGNPPGPDLREDLTFQHFATPATPTHSSQVVNEPFFSGDDTVVFVHGWNLPDDVNNDWKAVFAETMFKRLYWQGMRGEFVAFNWPTYADEEGPLNWLPDWLNQSYNPSDVQAYRSAQALRNVLEDYRGESPNLQPVHVLAHSMGNIVVGEAMRQWAADPNTEDPLVTNYVAMQAAVPAGAYGNNDTDTLYAFEFGRPITDFYRFWSHGRDGFSDLGLGVAYYFQPNNFSWENAINLYNVNDYALAIWDGNNYLKDSFIQPPIWPYDYTFEAGDGENENNDIFTRVPDVGTPVTLDLALPNGQPGLNAYEILAFYGVAASLPLGTKEVSYFDTNLDLEMFTMPGGSDIRLNHSYQFNHDAASIWDFYELLKTELGFDASHGSGAIAEASLVATDWSSRKPASSGVAESFVSIEDNRAVSQSMVSPSLSPDGHASFEFSRRLNLPARVTHTLDSPSESADLALLDLVGQQVESDEVLPANESLGYNEQDGEEVVAIDGFFETLGDAMVPIFG